MANNPARNLNAMLDGGRAADAPATPSRPKLPYRGKPWQELSNQLHGAKAKDLDWRAGRLPLYVYWRDEELHRVSMDAYAAYFVENALGRRAFPSVAMLERDVVGMGLDLLRAPDEADGSFTSGGTESIFQAAKTCRDRARAEKRLPAGTRGKLVVPRSAHPAFNKAAHYLDLDVVRVPLSADFRVDAAKMEDAVDARTIMIVASAPSYPHGAFDPIEVLDSIARKYDLWLHVDACVGGMLAPFMRFLGEPIPAFDFAVPSVTSISVDLHKYGFAAKGASLLLLRDGALKRYQRFEFEDWPRGAYMTETFLGTRPAGPIASAWAVMNTLGQEGYRAIARTIIDTKAQLAAGIAAIEGLEILQPSELSFLLYRSVDPDLDINAVGDGMAEYGWFVGRSLEPPAIHLMVNPVHAPVVEDYLGHLRSVVADVRARKAIGAVERETY
jgi:sphinganine-1-phosphate aldolase